MKYLPSGTQRYLVYLKMKDGQKKNLWLWERTTAEETVQGKTRIGIRQNWISSDTGYNKRELYSTVNKESFAPVYHYAYNNKTGKNAYIFTKDAVVTDDTVAAVGQPGFRQEMNLPAFNWELDLETFALLPLAEGKAFVIPFYHPGGKTPPKYYKYIVMGSEKIAGPDGQAIDCFLLYTEYENNQGRSTWWISKKNHEVLKMEELYGPIKRYKIKLAAAE